MADAKTKPTWASVREHLATIPDPVRRADCEALVTMMSRVTGAKPVMWGPTMVGFGSYHYRYDSGREGDAFLAGFADRKSDIAIYIVAGFEDSEALIAKLGKCKTTKSCLYVKRLADIDPGVLEALVSRSVAEMRRRYP